MLPCHGSCVLSEHYYYMHCLQALAVHGKTSFVCWVEHRSACRRLHLCMATAACVCLLVLCTVQSVLASHDWHLYGMLMGYCGASGNNTISGCLQAVGPLGKCQLPASVLFDAVVQQAALSLQDAQRHDMHGECCGYITFLLASTLANDQRCCPPSSGALKQAQAQCWC